MGINNKSSNVNTVTVNEHNIAIAVELGVKYGIPSSKEQNANLYLLTKVTGRKTRYSGPLATYTKAVTVEADQETAGV